MNTHPCSSCDEIVPIDEMDSCGRCEKCQREYPFEDDDYDGCYYYDDYDDYDYY